MSTLLLGEEDDEGVCRSTVPISMSALVFRRTPSRRWCRTSRNRRARVLMSALLLGEEDDDGFDQHVMDEKKATSLSESRAGPLSRSR